MSVKSVLQYFSWYRKYLYLGPQIWNMVPFEMKNLTTINAFKRKINCSQRTAHVGYVNIHTNLSFVLMYPVLDPLKTSENLVQESKKETLTQYRLIVVYKKN